MFDVPLRSIESNMIKDGFDPPRRGETQAFAFKKIADYIDWLREAALIVKLNKIMTED